MTNEEQFEEFWQSHRLYPDWDRTVWKAWQARGELDAKRIAELEAKITELHEMLRQSFISEEETDKKLDIAVEALEFICKDWSEPDVVAEEALTKIKGE